MAPLCVSLHQLIRTSRGLAAASGYPIRVFARGIFVVARRGNLLKTPVVGSIVLFNQVLCSLDESIGELASSYWRIYRIANHVSFAG
jgi:hypothetical protein